MASDLGLVQIDLDNLGKNQIPRLIASKTDPSTIRFT